MPLTEQQIDALYQRLNVIEAAIDDLKVAVSNLASVKQLKQLNIIKQNEVIDLKERVTALESQVLTLQGQVAP